MKLTILLVSIFFKLFVLYTTLLHVQHLIFHCAGGWWHRTQGCYDFGMGMGSQTLKSLG
jgi:hypothetical protein